MIAKKPRQKGYVICRRVVDGSLKAEVVVDKNSRQWSDRWATVYESLKDTVPVLKDYFSQENRRAAFIVRVHSKRCPINIIYDSTSKKIADKYKIYEVHRFTVKDPLTGK